MQPKASSENSPPCSVRTLNSSMVFGYASSPLRRAAHDVDAMALQGLWRPLASRHEARYRAPRAEYEAVCTTRQLQPFSGDRQALSISSLQDRDRFRPGTDNLALRWTISHVSELLWSSTTASLQVFVGRAWEAQSQNASTSCGSGEIESVLQVSEVVLKLSSSSSTHASAALSVLNSSVSIIWTMSR
ncbi:unnamed protein product [Phytophthora lilii]|uniref:Unnamed protein product n=1 Tax=Phytophthora lilii TaxID=2077276 RepID=A0A9W6XH40_9STRA|nr:unnamed protein product [Phytophthora lilii]